MTEGVETLRAAARWLGTVVAASAVLMFTAVALPWLLRMIEVDLGALAWTLTAFAATHAALMMSADRVRTRGVMLRVLYAIPLLGVAFMAVLWHFGGSVEHPALALAMVVPVIAAAVLPRPRFAFDVAIYSIVVVIIAAVIASPDFTWYLTQLGLPAGVLMSGEELLVRAPFAGATTTPAAVFLMVLTFAALQLTVAAVATRVARFIRTREELALRVQDHRADTLTARAVEATPAAAVIVFAATGQIVQASKRFRQQMLLHNDPVVGRELSELLAFADAEGLRAVLGEGGSIPRCRYSVGPEERIARVSVAPFEHDGMAYANVVIDDEVDAAESLPVALLLALLLGVPAANAQDALVLAGSADRLSGRNGGSVSAMWIHPRAHDTLFAGATFLSLADTRWGYATFGGTRRTGARTILNGEANLGGGRDDDGRFPYVLLRAGVTRELLARRLYGEAEWLQVDVARQQDGIARLGATLLARPRLTLRASLFQSLSGDNDITLGTMRADYDLGRVTAIAGFSAGTAVAALLQDGGSETGRVREAFAGAAFDAASRRWTVLVTSREDHQRISVTCRLPLR